MYSYPDKNLNKNEKKVRQVENNKINIFIYFRRKYGGARGMNHENDIQYKLLEIIITRGIKKTI